MNPMNPKVDAFLKKTKAWREEMVQLRSILLESGLTETIKWGKPCYMQGDTNLVVMVGFKPHCALILCQGALLKDPKGLLVKAGENTQAARQMRFTSAQDVAAKAATLKSYLREAIAAEKAGLQVEYKKPSEFQMPEELEKKLKGNAALKKAFAALTPGRQREYGMYFSGAKQAATREARVEKCVPLILSGKGLNDDYRPKKS